MAQDRLESGGRVLNVASLLIGEERNNQRIAFGEDASRLPPLFGSLKLLLEKLAQQTPNRIYYSQDGRVGGVVFFSEPSARFQAYLEPALVGGDVLSRGQGEIVVARNPEELEDEIAGWRERSRFARDLLCEPFSAIRGIHDREREFIHMGLYRGGAVAWMDGGDKIDRPISCRFSLSPVGIRMQELVIGDLTYLPTPVGQFEVVHGSLMPQHIQALRFHTHPFETKAA